MAKSAPAIAIVLAPANASDGDETVHTKLTQIDATKSPTPLMAANNPKPLPRCRAGSWSPARALSATSTAPAAAPLRIKAGASAVGQLVEPVQHGKESIDQLVDHKVKQECQLSVRHVRIRGNPLAQPVERVGRLVMDAHQILVREVEVMLSDQQMLGLQLCREEHEKNVDGVLVGLRTLVLVPNVLQRQRVECEGLLKQGEVLVVGLLDIEPEAALALFETRFEFRRDRREHRSRRGDQIPGYLISAEAPASFSFFSTPSASSRLTPCLTGLGAWSTRSFASFKPRPVISRTTLMTPILASPAAVKTTWNSVCSASGAAAAAPPAAGAAATATGAAAVTPNSVSIALMAFITSTTVHSLRLDTKSSTLTFAMGSS